MKLEPVGDATVPVETPKDKLIRYYNRASYFLHSYDAIFTTESEEALHDAVVYAEETLNIIKAGMRLVTSSGGTAYSIFRDFEYSVAGKTGSAQAKVLVNGKKVGIESKKIISYLPEQRQNFFFTATFKML